MVGIKLRCPPANPPDHFSAPTKVSPRWEVSPRTLEVSPRENSRSRSHVNCPTMQLHISLLLLCLSAQSTLCGPTKREASPSPDAEAEAIAEADPQHLLPGPVGPLPAPVGPVPPPQQFTSEPVCNSVPQRYCQPRQV